jgi:DNA-binding NarL/FixJ family response regulator
MRAIIADDHQIIRVGLSAILKSEPDIQVIGEATSAREALALVAREKPDVAILDLNFPDGSALAVVPELLLASPDTRILVLTMHSEAQMVRNALSSGVHGFLNKAAEPQEVVRAVRSVAQGRAFVSVPFASGGLLDLVTGEELARSDSAPPDSVAPRPEGRKLSEREREILKLFARGLTHRQIAEALGLSVKTVETYRSRLGDRFGARSRTELVDAAHRLGLLTDDEP